MTWPDDYIPEGFTPYHVEEAGIIFNCDCRDILPHLPKVDLVLTDPPYPNIVGGVKRNFLGGVSKRINYEKTVGQNWDSSLDWMVTAEELAIYGLLIFSSYLSLSNIEQMITKCETAGLITWFKRNSPPRGRYVPRLDTEFIWLFRKKSGLEWHNIRSMMIDIPLLQSGCMATERILNKDGSTLHPTQKPVQLIKQLLAIGGDIILDPFLGSGTTAVAAKELGRKFIGIEISEEYCAIAVKRLRQGVLNFG